MKVVMFNGSRRENGCTYTALSIVAKKLNEQGIETEILASGAKVAAGKLDEAVSEAAAAVKTADGVVIGSPVYYASPSGEIQMFLDRFWGVAGADLKFKPGAAVTSARRAGTTACIDVLNKYFTINQMPIVSSRYWNMVHGNTPAEVMQDEEGVKVMEVLGNNMAWLLRCIEAGKQAGIEIPAPEAPARTNFIR